LKLKKNKFPRFYFVSEDDLLYMLSNSNTPSLVIE
jgi:dynein heavy chain